MYSLFRSILFQMQPETSHNVSMKLMTLANKVGALRLVATPIKPQPLTVMGVEFPNPVGLAAGLDKNGDYIEAMGALGFGFVELGTVTPLAQPGNPQPRLFRLPEHQAIINRMGFNNKGVDHLVEQVKNTAFKGVIGINIGKNKDTPNDNALDDYLICMRKVYQHADYIVVNLSSPNTPGLRDLQFGEPLEQLLAGLKTEQKSLAEQHGKYVPVAVKIAPDMSEDDIVQVAGAIKASGIDGIVATNTTIDKTAVASSPLHTEAGGLSGAPVTDKSTAVIAKVREVVGDEMPIIGVGGILNSQHAVDKIHAGANLVQVYSGFIYKGPDLIRDSVAAIRVLGS
ncbi:Dihydroorotate dehydrogenase (quinone) [Sinobacterium norvegicum]|uniref:Dihydroorotate dehydrogenase (quinone) n=1 Tax=Sinobacterium norvegicum TaxID=1641715 RepID=A0ABM9AHP0_9GAMM|nr:quinone-dependent dihydroorotate dehydrogenase [Sinobacterium norvegicum]CAH0992739.1 Dihydroorotate dehydrogenase (quinone) [Sinobacterium norvegicum]